MELMQDGDYRYTLTLEKGRAGHTGYVLRLRQPAGVTKPPRVGIRFDLPDAFVNSPEAYRAAMEVVQRMVNGELRAMVPEIKKRIKDYDLYGSALFQLETGERPRVHAISGEGPWEPALRIVSRRATNKGATQSFNDEQTPLQRNGCGTPQRAAEYALEYGERLVLAFVPGLRI